MCGIGGIVAYGVPGAALIPLATRLRDRLRHRGPDDSGIAVLSRACITATRLSMLDAAGGSQPMTSADGRYTIVFNGEIYDHLALRRELPWEFRTRSDCETVLAAVASLGDAAAGRLNGMFAYFVWDAREERGFAARDRLGVKPLFLMELAGDLWFASEPKALVPELPRVRADIDAIVEYLVAPCFSGVERTPFLGITPLPAGHTLSVTRAGTRLRRYFEWPATPAPAESADPPALLAELRTCFVRAVARARAADADVGVFLSGGLDSTAIAAACGATRAYTIAFDDQAGFDYAGSRMVIADDLPYARAAARALDAPLDVVSIGRTDLGVDLPQLARQNELLPAWEQELAQHRLAQAAARDVKGVMVGDAADETHFGYHFLLDAQAIADPAAIIGRFAGVPVRAEIDADPVARLGGHYRALIEAAGGSFGSWSERVSATTWLIVNRWLPRLLWNGDVHTMAHSLEARVPFADVDLLAVAARVPPAIGLHAGVEKGALRQALIGLVPEPIRVRRKSALPKDQAAQATYQGELRRLLADPHPLVNAVVDLPKIAPLLDRPVLLESERAALFRVASLSYWARHYKVELS